MATVQFHSSVAKRDTKIMFAIRPFEDNDAEYEAVVAVWNAIWPTLLETVEEWKYSDKIRDTKYLYQRLVVEVTNQIVAYASYGECAWSHKPGKYFIDISVHPGYQRRGIGTALYDNTVHILADHHPITFTSYTREDKPQAICFLTQRGFKQVMRQQVSHLDVSAFDHNKFTGIAVKMQELGIQIYTVSQLEPLDPNWKHKIWDLEWELLQDVPSPDPPTRQTFEKFEKTLESPNFQPDAYFIAIDDDRYVGVTSLWSAPADKDKLYTELTGVVRSYRRKGVATALKLRAIEFAERYGAKIIETDNEENNPMYSLNMKLGFKPQPAWLSFKKIVKEEVEEDSSG